jgi:hypothetical protein
LSFSILSRPFKGTLIPLDFSYLTSEAIRRTGVQYSCDQYCEESLKILIDSINDEAGLSVFGQIAARQHLLELLETRFKLIDCWRRTPDIQAQAINPQIIITGMPKSGSTFLHRLLSLDVNNRAPRMWEVMFPLPLPVSDSVISDLRIRKAEKRLRWLRWIHPAIAQAHPIGARIPQECGAISFYSFESNAFLDMFSIPAYEAWLRSRDMRCAYEIHRSFLKHLQWECPAKRWVLKSSDHVHSLHTLLKIYPDARIIFLHRDPIRVLQAAASQMTLVKGLFSNNIDRRQLGAYESRVLCDKVRKLMEFRDSHSIPEERCVDIRYQDLASDPVGTVRTIYKQFNLILPDEDEARMEAFANDERTKKRSDKFSLEDFALDPEQELACFETYCERYRVGRELL